jgi:hypothetical protein
MISRGSNNALCRNRATDSNASGNANSISTPRNARSHALHDRVVRTSAACRRSRNPLWDQNRTITGPCVFCIRTHRAA